VVLWVCGGGAQSGMYKKSGRIGQRVIWGSVLVWLVIYWPSGHALAGFGGYATDCLYCEHSGSNRYYNLNLAHPLSGCPAKSSNRYPSRWRFQVSSV
jgi:hypothetical protein